MALTMNDILHPGSNRETDPDFRNAPEGWQKAEAEAEAAKAGIKLVEDHWEAIRVLQACYTEDTSPPRRLLRDALEAKFDTLGGMTYLHQKFPDGPIVQGCRLAGLNPPAGSEDPSFGTVA